ncbi:unnamed protein product [Rhizoctonia solani]|uniref:Uncharacterized protein n=1 Tax=Rhizoctonia solani TaxID=456999 RepID=A0A8H3GQ40_9AGAM|nr:unnamed protein product [Rhizoctonia solani]
MPVLHNALAFVALIASIAQAGNTTCKTTSLDWYTRSVGETPCRTYERLHQICTSDYEVGNFGSIAPGDKCDVPFRACCCNSIAWSLSMLCMNCQYGTGSGVFGDPGIDAGVGAYGVYLNNCGTPTNKILRNDVQLGICEQNISLPAFLYEIFWVDGPWFYGSIKGYAQLDISGGKNDTGLCPATRPTATFGDTTATPSESSKSGVPVGAIAGGVIGGVVLLIGSVLLGFFISKIQKDKRVIELTEQTKPTSATFEYYGLPVGATAQRPIATYNTVLPPQTRASGPRRNKPGLIAPSPPTRAEVYQSQPLLLTETESSSYATERHEDSEDLTNAFGLDCSAGLLPPSYRR